MRIQHAHKIRQLLWRHSAPMDAPETPGTALTRAVPGRHGTCPGRRAPAGRTLLFDIARLLEATVHTMADEDPADQGLSLAYRAGRPADSEPGSAAILERACFLGEDAGGAKWRLWHRLLTPSKDQEGHGEDLVGDVTTRSPTGTARTALALVRAGVELTATEAARPRLVAILRELSQPGETESLGEQPPDLRALLSEVADAVERGRGHVRSRVSARTLPPLVKFPADRIHAGTVQGLARAAEWSDGVGGFFRALEIS